jgi:beta-phosphoglucomutase-like phosphatase (HAD superfamily)
MKMEENPIPATSKERKERRREEKEKKREGRHTVEGILETVRDLSEMHFDKQFSKKDGSTGGS